MAATQKKRDRDEPVVAAAAPASLLQLYDVHVTVLKQKEDALKAKIKEAETQLQQVPPPPPAEATKLQQQIKLWKGQLGPLDAYILRAIPFLNQLYVLEERRDRERSAARAAGDAAREAEISVHWSNAVHRLTAEFVHELHPESELAQAKRSRFAAKASAAPAAAPTACANCGAVGKMRRQDDVNVCMAPNCGALTGKSIMSSSFADSQRTRTVRRFRYARINHLREFLRQRQALQKNAPNPAVTQLVREGIKRRWQDVPTHKLRPYHIHDVLKNENLSKFYKYIQYLTRQLNPQYQPPFIDPLHTERLTYLFYKAEEAFNRTKHRVCRNRENLVSYRYVCKQLCRLLGPAFTEYIWMFPDLKSVDLQQKQDRFWREICKELKWPYMPTTGNQLSAQDFRLPSADDGLVAVGPEQSRDEMPITDDDGTLCAEGGAAATKKRKRAKAAAAAAPAMEDESMPKRLRRITRQRQQLTQSLRKLNGYAPPPPAPHP
jgi:hypothetical protein